MPNTNRNMVQDAENEIRNKAIKKYHEENRFDLIYLSLMLCCCFFLAVDCYRFSIFFTYFSYIFIHYNF